jgi:hypothetical protein
MARVIPISNAFPCSLNPTVRGRYRHCHVVPLHASTDEGGETADKSDETTSSSADPDFERRIAELTTRYISLDVLPVSFNFLSIVSIYFWDGGGRNNLGRNTVCRFVFL